MGIGVAIKSLSKITLLTAALGLASASPRYNFNREINAHVHFDKRITPLERAEYLESIKQAELEEPINHIKVIDTNTVPAFSEDYDSFPANTKKISENNSNIYVLPNVFYSYENGLIVNNACKSSIRSISYRTKSYVFGWYIKNNIFIAFKPFIAGTEEPISNEQEQNYLEAVITHEIGHMNAGHTKGFSVMSANFDFSDTTSFPVKYSPATIYETFFPNDTFNLSSPRCTSDSLEDIAINALSKGNLFFNSYKFDSAGAEFETALAKGQDKSTRIEAERSLRFLEKEHSYRRRH